MIEIEESNHCLEFTEVYLKISLIIAFLISFLLCKYIFGEEGKSNKGINNDRYRNEKKEEINSYSKKREFGFDEATLNFFLVNN